MLFPFGNRSALLVTPLHLCGLSLALSLLICDQVSAQELVAPGEFGVNRTEVAGAVSNGAVPNGLAANDWKSIRGAYDAGRHKVYSVDGGYAAHNPGQQWSTKFDGRAFLTTPDSGEWSWGLELLRFGFAGQEQGVTSPDRVTVDGGRLGYVWTEGLEEWYKNGVQGLEHGYTVLRRPVASSSASSGHLSFTLAVRGGLHADVLLDGRGVRFLGDRGAAVVTYTGLVAFDADGRDLPAKLELVGQELRIVVDEQGARYPITVDPTAQQAYLKASNTGVDDWFGFAVAVSGDTAVVGARWEDSNAKGVNGNQADNSAKDAGAVYVFVRNGATWSQQAYLKASNTDSKDEFGFKVAVSGDTILVGAPFEGGSSRGVNGNQGSNSAPSAGATYVFVRSGTTWSQQAYLKSSNAESLDQFGISVSIASNTAVVGASGESSNAAGVNRNQFDNSLSYAGAAYVFVRSGSAWIQQAYLKASNTDKSDYFGLSVGLAGDTIVVGASGEASPSRGTFGSQNGNSASGAGAAYVFVRSGTNWAQQAYLKASNTEAWDRFGSAVSVSGDTIAVGAPAEDSGGVGVNGTQANNGLASSGAVYVFVRMFGRWSQQVYLKASNTGANDSFGGSVDLSGDKLVVGAQGEGSRAVGVNGDQLDNTFRGAGAVYVFARRGTAWCQQAYLKASNTGVDDRFGGSVAVSGDTVVSGAFYEDSSATGVNGNPGSVGKRNSGAAYAFELVFADCNGNGIPDCFDIGSGLSTDCNRNGIPDSCDLLTGVSKDCNNNGISDDCELASGAEKDCNGNGILDSCDIASGFSKDCNKNGVPDTCDYASGVGKDCNSNGIMDACDILSGFSKDCNKNGIPDVCDYATGVGKDCNGNGIMDACEILTGAAKDCNKNGVPDACDLLLGVAKDCNGNGIPDSCDITTGLERDCNGNAIPDSCDLLSGFAKDCNGNGVPDSCDIVAGIEKDCNGNGVPDSCDLAVGLEKDCNGNGIPDSCDLVAGREKDCNGNGIPDSCDIAVGQAQDCNVNGIPDSCDIATGFAKDCNGNGVPDSCDIAAGLAKDCNLNGIPDFCDIRSGFAKDCNQNAIPDSCDIAAGTSKDCNGNGRPDSCEFPAGTSTNCGLPTVALVGYSRGGQYMKPSLVMTEPTHGGQFTVPLVRLLGWRLTGATSVRLDGAYNAVVAIGMQVNSQGTEITSGCNTHAAVCPSRNTS